ncbi:MAG: DUF4333 domain-containing protein [Solirubrobacteraceae bacterium]
MLRRVAVTVLAPSAAALLSACGSASAVVIDHNVVQSAIEVGIAQQQHVLSIVTCPPGVKATRGARFTCTVTFADGRQASIVVTATDDLGDVRYAGLNGYVNGHPAAPSKP